MDIEKGKNEFYITDNEGRSVAEITYVNQDKNTIVIDHTYVAPKLRGRGIAACLVKKVVDFAREENKKIIPACWFAKNEFIDKPEYSDVLFKS
ncbi:GNAT family N-acetyltransferase [Clostridium oryzae]|uniref:Acetyltransferase (GNAT) family protein n=1 Tax=Clostridium oryzae TaxID=1450648 RepID=A0A1V4IE05_9CLOT|nr:GNAT family N-acetyltransferase [Clostridium oryzae]OPJ58176.1 acetyltransferase (GNAT) family protein [Clostridium oryzae]